MRAIRIAVVGIAFLAGTHSAYAQCVGDCDGSNTVTVNELVSGVNIALDRAAVSTCPSFDGDSSGAVTVNELVSGVNNLLRGCSVQGTPTPTPAISASRTNTPTATGPINTPTPTLPPPTITFQTCDFRGTSDALAIYLTNTILFTTLQPEGELGVGCTGTGAARQCACEFRAFDPLLLTGLGFVCIEEGKDSAGNPAVCPIGKQVCDTGASTNIDLLADAQIGSCTTNADCAAQCDTYCGALNPPHVRFSGACESHCQGGTRTDESCECDILGSATCAAASTTDCPQGSCEGKDNEPDIDCHCQCVDEASPGTNIAGGFECRLAVSIRVEANSPCDGNDVLVRLPPQCAPLTSAQHSGTGINTNEDPNADIVPPALQGASVSCDTFDTSPVGMKLVTNLVFFDSTVGDLMSQLSLTCQ